MKRQHWMISLCDYKKRRRWKHISTKSIFAQIMKIGWWGRKRLNAVKITTQAITSNQYNDTNFATSPSHSPRLYVSLNRKYVCWYSSISRVHVEYSRPRQWELIALVANIISSNFARTHIHIFRYDTHRFGQDILLSTNDNFIRWNVWIGTINFENAHSVRGHDLPRRPATISNTYSTSACRQMNEIERERERKEIYRLLLLL